MVNYKIVLVKTYTLLKTIVKGYWCCKMNDIGGKLHFFASFAQPFQARFMNQLWNRYPEKETNHWDSMSLFLEGYAFERQGRRPDYAHVAINVIMTVKSNSSPIDRSTETVWDFFKNDLEGKNLNEANNPLCPRGTNYTRKTGATITNKQSIIEFFSGLPTDVGGPNIITFAKNELGLDAVKIIHNNIQQVNGIGSKIASLFLRDVAVFYKIFPSKDRYLLQPVDIWVGRIVEKLGGPKYEIKEDVIKKIQLWIVENARGVAEPEEINQGMWYFASQIAGSNYRLEKTLDHLGYAKELAYQHKHALKLGAESIILE